MKFTHRIVAELFVPKSDDPLAVEVDHLDGNRANPAVYNLEWVTRVENVRRAYERGSHKTGCWREESKSTAYGGSCTCVTGKLSEGNDHTQNGAQLWFPLDNDQQCSKRNHMVSSVNMRAGRQSWEWGCRSSFCI